jgi:hypothetical protein
VAQDRVRWQGAEVAVKDLVFCKSSGIFSLAPPFSNSQEYLYSVELHLTSRPMPYFALFRGYLCITGIARSIRNSVFPDNVWKMILNMYSSKY